MTGKKAQEKFQNKILCVLSIRRKKKQFDFYSSLKDNLNVHCSEAALRGSFKL